MKNCSYCGQPNEDAATVCSGCGEEFPIPAPSQTDPQLEDPTLSLVTLATFSSLAEASLLVGRLETAGIEACIPEEYAEGVFSGIIPLERLTVRVAARDYEAAKMVLAEWNQGSEPTAPSPTAD